MTKTALPILQSNRSCGECDACCVWLDVEDEGIAHTRGVRCPRLGDDGKCQSYDERPRTCRDFECLWLVGFGGEEDRPDRLGVILHLMPPTSGVVVVAANEIRPGAVDEKRAAETIKEIAWQAPVITVRLDGSKSSKIPVRFQRDDAEAKG